MQRARRAPRSRATRLLRVLAALCAATLPAGCGSQDAGGSGGRVAGDTLTVVSLLPLSGPEAPVARDLLRGEKLALAEANGAFAPRQVTMSALDEGGASREQVARDAARSTRLALSDSQAIAVIGSLRFESAAVAVPLLNAAGLLHVSPTVGYRGFTEPVAAGEPERWYPSGRRTFHPGAADATQAAATVDAIRAVTRRPPPRILVEHEAGAHDLALAEAIAEAARRSSARVVEDPSQADAVVYVGDDAVAARGIAEDLVREAPGARLVFGDDLVRMGFERGLPAAVARRALLVSRAPRPDSTPELRRFSREYAERFGRAPRPYAALGHAVMRSVLIDGIGRAGRRADERDQVAEAYLGAAPELPAPSAFALRGGRRAYLRLETAGR